MYVLFKCWIKLHLNFSPSIFFHRTYIISILLFSLVILIILLQVTYRRKNKKKTRSQQEDGDTTERLRLVENREEATRL